MDLAMSLKTRMVQAATGPVATGCFPAILWQKDEWTTA
jgi:hypothetical protein